jgi:DNA-binding LacI/PurR family transcriptional regulator/DNA-binding transcriptional regulator YhcF (GntR family)
MSIRNSLSSLSIDPRSDLGIATQIRARIAFLVADGELAPGERLPSVRGLAAQLGVNVNTIRAAYAELERDGLVRTRHGVGTVVLAAPPARLPPGVRPLGVNTVAVLIGGLNPFYLALLRGIEDVAAEHGTLVLIVDTRDSPRLAEALLRRLIPRGVDGIITVSVGGFAKEAESRETDDGRLPPIVYVDQPDRKGHVLLFDGHAAGYAATRHLREHGHKRIGIITAPRSWPNVYEVCRGYIDALHDTGCQIDSNLIAEVDAFTIETGRLGLAHLLEQRDPPSAVFAAGQVLALGALREAQARQLDVPAHLALCGYTDTPTATLVQPPLTMVAVPAHEIGIRAMQTLAILIQGKTPRPRRTTLPVELILRDSCGHH